MHNDVHGEFPYLLRAEDVYNKGYPRATTLFRIELHIFPKRDQAGLSRGREWFGENVPRGTPGDKECQIPSSEEGEL